MTDNLSTAHGKCATKNSELVALADCDSFFASCERVCRPDLYGKPIVVLSNNDGCIVARSREAKKLGIPMGEPEFKLRAMLARGHVAVFSSNYALYGDLSRRVMQTLESVAPDVEVYSIDEAFILLNRALAANANEVAREMRSRVFRWVGLPISIGIAPTRVLAKIAAHVAKKYPAYRGIFNLAESKKVDLLLSTIPVGDLWGIGRKSAIRLKTSGICTALQLRDADPDWIRSMLTVNGLNILMELRGIPSIKEDIPQSHTTIISSRSLGYKVATLEPLTRAIAFHAARAAEKLRVKKLCAQMVTVRIQTAWYAQDEPRHDGWTSRRLERPVFDSAPILAAARDALMEIYKPGFGYAKAMVMLTDLSDPAKSQGDLREFMGDQKEKDSARMRLMNIVDKINRLEGRGTVTFAAQGSAHEDWHMRRDHLSPRWTTNSRELLQVHGEAGHYSIMPKFEF